MVGGVPFRVRPWCGTGERPRGSAWHRLGGQSVQQAPAVAVAHGEATLFQFEQGIAETGIVDAQSLTQGGSGQRLSGLLESGAHRLGERRRGDESVEAQRKRLVAAVQAQQDEVGRGAISTVSSRRPTPKRAR